MEPSAQESRFDFIDVTLRDAHRCLWSEFLERANTRDSECVNEAPAAHLEPWIPRLRRELAPSARDEDVLLAALYDSKLVEPLRNPVPECRFRITPLAELVGFLVARRDIGYARMRFAGTAMTVAA